MKYIKLSNDYNVPSICYGTGIVSHDLVSRSKIKRFLKRVYFHTKYILDFITYKDVRKYKHDYGVMNCCKHALSNGCSFFDTSRAYGGAELMLGEALKKFDRNRFFICTKIDNNTQLNNMPAKETLKKSMEELGVEYVDILLLHWPVEESFLYYWKQLEELYKEGFARAIGVSNCKIHHLKEIKKIAEIMPMVNEVELHPLLSELELRRYCKENGIQLMAYSSNARLDFRIKSSRRLKSVCEKYNKSLTQIIARWHIQNDIIPIFSTSSLAHFRENMDVFDFELDEESMRIIDSVNINARTRYDSDNCEWDRL